MDLSEYKELLQEKKSFVNIAFVQKNGKPHVTPLWFNMSDENVKNGIMNINTATGRVKANNFAVGTQLALSIQDPDNSYNYIGFHAIIKTLIQGQEANDHIDALTKKYFNKDTYPSHNPNEQRIKVIIKLEHKYGG